MKRGVSTLLAVLVVLAAAGAGVGAWHLARDRSPQQPQVSAYSNGQLTRVGPYMYCDVLDLNNCRITQEQGELVINHRQPVQLSVDAVIGRAPWRLFRVYAAPADTTATLFRPDTTLAVTIPTVDPQRGPLRGLVVQLLTLVVDPAGELFDVPHAEWSVRLVWG